MHYSACLTCFHANPTHTAPDSHFWSEKLWSLKKCALHTCMYTCMWIGVENPWCTHGCYILLSATDKTDKRRVECVALFTLHPSHINNIQPVPPHVVKNACMYGTFLKTIKIPGMFVVVILKMHLYQLSQIRRDDNIQPCMQEEHLLYKGTLRE